MKTKKVIQVKGTTIPGAPLSQAIEHDSLIFVSGTVSLDLESGKPLFGSIEQETKQVFNNIKRILEEAGSSLDCVLKTTVFLTRKEDFNTMNEIYSGFFPNDKPARTTIIVQLAADFKIEIEAVAYIP